MRRAHNENIPCAIFLEVGRRKRRGKVARMVRITLLSVSDGDGTDESDHRWKCNNVRKYQKRIP